MPKTALQRLTKYRDDHVTNDYELAELLDLTAPHMSQILSGRRRPGLATAARIEDVTGIPARAWAEKRKSKRAQATQSAA